MKRLAEKLHSLGYVDRNGRIYKPLPTLKIGRTVEEQPYQNTVFVLDRKVECTDGATFNFKVGQQ